MQSSLIKIGEKYAFEYEGEERALTITKITTVKEEGKTTNSFSGHYTEYNVDSQRRVTVTGIDPKDIINAWEKHDALKAEETRVAAARAEKEAARKAKQLKAVDLLAAAIGAQAVHAKHAGFGPEAKARFKQWDEEAPAVMVDYSNIEINEEAFDLIISTFGAAE